MDWKQKLGKEIRRARESRGMTQKGLREALLRKGFKFSLPTIGYYERGERVPDFDDLRNFAEVLSRDRFEIEDNLRIEFSRNGKARLEPVAQQLTLKFDEGESVAVRIECVSEGLIITKVNRA
jgi:transcriptional regulator with XRE-family HTH domain